MDNPFVRPGCLKVDEIFKLKGQVVPFMGPPFENIEQMLATFDKPEELYIVTYGVKGSEPVQAIAHKRDAEHIEYKRKLTDEFIAKVGKPFGSLTVEDCLWVKREVERAMLESN